MSRLGQLIFLNHQFVKALMRKVDAIKIGCGTKVHGKRKNPKVLVFVGQNVGTRIGNNANCHGNSFQDFGAGAAAPKSKAFLSALGRARAHA